MSSKFFHVFSQLFDSMTVADEAMANVEIAGKNLSVWAEESAHAFTDQARKELSKQLHKLLAELNPVKASPAIVIEDKEQEAALAS